MNRRQFLTSMLSLSAATVLPTKVLGADLVLDHNKKIKPYRLKKGDKVGLVTPGSPITEDLLNVSVENLTKLGYVPVYLPSVLDVYGYEAGKPKDRADELMKMFENKDIKAIWSVRGGYSAVKILDLLDYQTIKNNPKIFIGYSDITILNNAITTKTGLVTFHGPVGISTFNDFSLNAMNNVIVSPHIRYKYEYIRDEDTLENPEYDLYTITEGKASGELIGGNLTLLESVIGTEYDIDYKNKIVYIEEVHEKTYKVDRMLTHLVMGTNIKEAAGIVLGIFKGCDSGDEPRHTLKEVFDNIIKPLNIPASYGFPFGHVSNKLTLPNGIKAKFNATENYLKLLEKPVM